MCHLKLIIYNTNVQKKNYTFQENLQNKMNVA